MKNEGVKEVGGEIRIGRKVKDGDEFWIKKEKQRENEMKFNKNMIEGEWVGGEEIEKINNQEKNDVVGKYEREKEEEKKEEIEDEKEDLKEWQS